MKNQKLLMELLTQAKLLISNSIRSLFVLIFGILQVRKNTDLTKFFYNDAAIAILVYDITRRNSFDEVKNYWYEQLKTCGEKNLVLGLVGNKCDMFNKEAVTEEEAQAFAKQIGAQFKLTSAFKNNGIDELFKLVGNKYLDPNFQGEIIKEGDKPGKIVLTKEDQKKKDKENKSKGGCCK